MYTEGSILQDKPTIVFLGTYPPRACGIATFNQDLLLSSQRLLGDGVACKAAAMNLFPLDTCLYPKEVEWQLDQNNKKDYLELANTINQNARIRGLIIQHEYGIYGGVDGANILACIKACRKPIVVTLHTVLPNPSPAMKAVTDKIIRRASIIVVLTKRSSIILARVYPHSKDKLYVIPHGIHATAFTKTAGAKLKLHLEQHTVLSTFGLLNRGKGIEYVIRSLPNLVKKHPSLLYLVLGETHPVVRRAEGESYRNELTKLVTQLDLKRNVRFYDQYLTLSDLLGFLKATDIYISSSINPHQAVSGTLSYALGTGRAVISTAFAQARELITLESGRLVPIKDPRAYGRALDELLANPATLEKMHRRAYEITRPMQWSNVAQQYSQLLTRHILPPINLTHLKKMTDAFGMFQFATLDQPNKAFGYTLDDNARALVICSWLSVSKGLDMTTLMRTYLHFIKACQQADGTFVNYIDFPKQMASGQNDDEDLEDPAARAMWALSEVMGSDEATPALKRFAKTMFVRALPHSKKQLHIRSTAFMIKAFAKAQAVHPEIQRELRDGIVKNADFLIREFAKHAVKSWQWFETQLNYGNAVVPESLLIAGEITHNPHYTEKGVAALMFLIQKTFSAQRYMPIGHSHWYKNHQKRSKYDQQPEDPASMILALRTAFEITLDTTYLDLIPVCFSWFMGNNSLELPLYNFANGGCYDGLHPDRVNLNQGAESQCSYLLSRLAVSEVNTL